MANVNQRRGALMNSLLELIQCGQSYWMDNLSRGMIQSGALKKRIIKEGLRGITSNPTIFNKAISKSIDYDAQIRDLSRNAARVEDIYEQLVVKDVQDACDLLRPVFDESKGVDGFVSLEVSPYLAHDTERTMQETRRLFHAVDRPNVFIKIPGTTAGVLAIEEMLYEGVNINITLLFSVERYEAVAKAYLTALERRLAQSKPVDDVASVASFFLSRIDILVDQLLQHRMGQNNEPAQALTGKLAIANAKLAYQSFKKIFSSSRWKKLEEKGARVQRPLWASTSTKNPQYSDVFYVEPLIGPHTVNTMPEETIAAFADHGRVKKNTVEENVVEAAQTMAELERLGIDFRCVAWQLENEGVQKFIDPFGELMRTIAAKYQLLAS
jgi:transaldolase